MKKMTDKKTIKDKKGVLDFVSSEMGYVESCQDCPFFCDADGLYWLCALYDPGDDEDGKTRGGDARDWNGKRTKLCKELFDLGFQQ